MFYFEVENWTVTSVNFEISSCDCFLWWLLSASWWSYSTTSQLFTNRFQYTTTDNIHTSALRIDFVQNICGSQPIRVGLRIALACWSGHARHAGLKQTNLAVARHFDSALMLPRACGLCGLRPVQKSIHCWVWTCFKTMRKHQTDTNTLRFYWMWQIGRALFKSVLLYILQQDS